MARVKLIPGGSCFSCEGRQSILDAALSASVALGYGCSSGSCGLCIGRLVKGKIEKVRHHDLPLTDANRLRGDFLLCSFTAASPEVIIEADEAAGGEDIPWQNIEARIKRLDACNENISIVRLQTPRTNRLRFLPGQNVRLTLKDGSSSVNTETGA